MLIIFLDILLYVLKTAEVLAVSLLLAIGVDQAIYLYNAGDFVSPKRAKQLRNIARKEKEANESFFEEPYVRGFGPDGEVLYRGCQVPFDQERAYRQGMDEIDKLVDRQIFENTKDL